MLIDEGNVEEIIQKIRTIHQTSIDQRECDLTEYLLEVFQSIEEHEQINLANVCRLLANLLRDYVDRAALKIELLKGKCLETIDRILVKQIDNEENLISILQFIAELPGQFRKCPTENSWNLMVMKKSFVILIMSIHHRLISSTNYFF